MEYTINKLARLAGVSTRTLRWYHECGLLPPKAVRANGYRIYGQAELDRLQQILFYRELGLELAEIGRILAAPDFDGLAAMQQHQAALLAKREQLDRLLANVAQTIRTMKGACNMSDEEKFAGFKQQLIDDNERQYGAEIRAKYGADAVAESNAKLQGMSQAQYEHSEALRREFETSLQAALAEGDPAGALAQQACDLHRQWLSVFYPSYSKEYHRGLSEMYVADERFRANYDKLGPGCTEFLRDAIQIYCR